MNLFDDKERVHTRPAFYNEPEFSYLNDSARPEMERVRQMLEEWSLHYPAIESQEKRVELLRKLLSDLRAGGRKFTATFFELFLHELLIRVGCHIVEIEPEIPNSTRRPDFLIEDPNGVRFYLEATAAFGENEKKAAIQAKESELYDLINKIESPKFFLMLRLISMPQKQPSARKIRSFLVKCLEQANYDEVVNGMRSGSIDSLPMWPYRQDGCAIDFYPVPKSEGAWDKESSRAIGVHLAGPNSVGMIDDIGDIRKALEEKSSRYGILALPYIIAVNALSLFANDKDFYDALFGRVGMRVKPGGEKPEVRGVRMLDGFWMDASGPRHEYVNGVLAMVRVSPYSLSERTERCCIYYSPWNKEAAAPILPRIPRVVRIGQAMERQEGDSLAKIFGLPIGWPETSDFGSTGRS